MLADVYRARLGLTSPQPLTTVTVRDPTGAEPPTAIAERIGPALVPVLGEVPVPLVIDGTAVVVLLALVPPAETVAALGALRNGLAPFQVSSRQADIHALESLGALADRLTSATEPLPS